MDCLGQEARKKEEISQHLCAGRLQLFNLLSGVKYKHSNLESRVTKNNQDKRILNYSAQYKPVRPFIDLWNNQRKCDQASEKRLFSWWNLTPIMFVE